MNQNPVIITEYENRGARAVIKAGVTIGKNSVVAMGAIVTRDVEENTLLLPVLQLF